MTRKPGKSTPSTSRDDADAAQRDADASASDTLPESLLDLPEGSIPADSGEADELLASLADEQINRLTLEDEEARENIEAREARTGSADLTPEEVAALRTEWDQPPPPITEDSPEDDTVTSMPTDDELDALLRGEEAPAPPAGHLEVELDSAADDEMLSDAAAQLAAELDSQPEAVGHGREAHDDADGVEADVAVEARGGINTVEPTAAQEGEPATRSAERTPLYLRPLIWLNAPLARAPESVRDMIGKIALITTLNAVAVFIYVFIIRR